MTADSYEPNNSPESAKFISTDNISQMHTIHSAADLDWIKVSFVAGHYYFIQLNSRYDLFNFSLYSANDFSKSIFTSTTHSHDFSYICTESGDYYIKIVGSGLSDYNFAIDDYTSIVLK